VTLSYKDVAEILKIIDASDCEELVLELEGARMVVRRSAGGGDASGQVQPQTQMPSPAPTASPTGASPSAVPEQASSSPPSDAPTDGSTIRSPMVGTFYRRPAPDQDPFVEKGDRIKFGDPLCLIEVMKLYTTIESTLEGTVNAVMIEDGALVEFDQPLFSITLD
jgi:acetyl-CoA carboxylase biotin carboxyl carrier protein